MDTEEKKEERKKAVRDKLAGYIYDVSKLIVAGLVIGGISPMFSNGGITASNAVVIIGGALFSVGAAYVAYRIMDNIKQ